MHMCKNARTFSSFIYIYIYIYLFTIKKKFTRISNKTAVTVNSYIYSRQSYLQLKGTYIYIKNSKLKSNTNSY